MNKPQEKMSGEQPPHPKANFKDTPIGKAFPFMVGGSVVVGLGSGVVVYCAISETTRSDKILTFCVGTLIVCVVGGFIGYLSKMVINSLCEQQAKFKDTSFANVLPLTLVTFLCIGFGGQGIYGAIGKITGWGTYTIATFCVGTLIAGIVGGFIGGVSQMIINSFGKEVKG